MTVDEAIEMYANNAEYERTHGSLLGCMDFKQLADWLKELKQLREQEPCEDAVSRQAVIKAVDLHTFDTDDGLCLDDDISCILENLPSVTPTQKWIPVSERLPEKNMACLVSVGKFHITQIAIYSDLMQTIDHKIFYQGDYGHDSFRDITKYVNKWMPLPKDAVQGKNGE